MIYRIIVFVIGVILSVIGITYVVLAASYFFTGYGLGTYFSKLFKSPEIYLLFLGLVLLIWSCFFDGFWIKVKHYLKSRRHL